MYRIRLELDKQFQYNPCYCLSSFIDKDSGQPIIVSIQPLLLFIVHTMLLTLPWNQSFNTTLVTVYHFQAYFPGWNNAFQYNPCYCLSRLSSSVHNSWPSFNTTLVTVYLICQSKNIKIILFQYNPCYCLSQRLLAGQNFQSVSIQPLLLFIRSFCLTPCSV